MATKVGLAIIWMTPLDWPTTKTPTQVQNSGNYRKCELSYCDFCVEISTFSLPWQRWLAWHKFHLHSEIGSSRKTLFGARILTISHTHGELLSTFWCNLPIFVTMATKVRLAKIWMTPLDWLTTKTPTQVQNSGIYLKCELSYCDFCVEISTFSLPWQRGLAWHKFRLHSKIGSYRKPLFGARILTITHTQAEL